MIPVEKDPDRGPGRLEASAVVGDHVLLRCIGRGGYGEVWLARAVTGSLRAVKIIHRDAFEESAAYEREFAGIRRFEPISREHPHQIHVLHVGRADAGRYYYYVMEPADDLAGGSGGPGSIVDGNEAAALSGYRPRTLQSELARAGHLPVGEVVRIGIALASALEHLHGAGLVHRDVKPANVIFVRGVPKLADIGLVTDANGEGIALGTRGYQPPDAATGAGADLYALGKVLYELATGLDRLQFPESPADLPTRPDREHLLRLDDILHRACDPSAARRYSSARELRSDLENLARELRRPGTGARRAWGLTRTGWVASCMLLMLLLSAWFLFPESPGLKRGAGAVRVPETDADDDSKEFVLLIETNGSLAGWTSKFGNWEIRDGVVLRERGGGHLHRTRFLPASFDLRFEWRIGTNADSGIRYADGHAEYQCVDDGRNVHGREAHRRSGSLFGIDGPDRSAARPAGAWNEGRIVKRGSRVEHWLNGRCVARADLSDPAVAARIRESTTFRPAGLSGLDYASRRPDESVLALVENHGAVAFRGLKYRELRENAGEVRH